MPGFRRVSGVLDMPTVYQWFFLRGQIVFLVIMFLGNVKAIIQTLT